MAKKNVLQEFERFTITKKESNGIRGGRSRNPIDTGSFGFVNWDDIEVRDPGVVIVTGANVKLSPPRKGSL